MGGPKGFKPRTEGNGLGNQRPSKKETIRFDSKEKKKIKSP